MATIPNLPGGERTGLLDDDQMIVDDGSTSTKILTMDKVSEAYQKLLSMGASITSTSSQTLTTDSLTLVEFDTTEWAVHVITDTLNDRLPIGSGQGGIYIATADIVWDTATTTALHRVVIRLNGTVNIAQSGAYSDSSGTFTQSAGIIYKVANNDDFKLYAYQNTGGNFDIAYARLSIARLWVQ